MADQLAVLEKKGPDQSRNLYVVGAPAYRVESHHSGAGTRANGEGDPDFAQ